jgi:hypothetical protein
VKRKKKAEPKQQKSWLVWPDRNLRERRLVVGAEDAMTAAIDYVRKDYIDSGEQVHFGRVSVRECVEQESEDEYPPISHFDIGISGDLLWWVEMEFKDSGSMDTALMGAPLPQARRTARDDEWRKSVYPVR